jgi:uncharacterized protein CbrC (UPF0167 family)
MSRKHFLTAGLCAVALLTLFSIRAGQAGASSLQAPVAQSGGRAERTTWFFYKVKWGHQEEFVDLFQKNHYPVLKEEIKAGRMTSVRTFVPTYHGDGRADWTFAVAITFKDTAAMMGPSGEEEIVRRLYPNHAQFLKEEQRRFEILDAHWDVPLNEVNIDTRRPSGQ